MRASPGPGGEWERASRRAEPPSATPRGRVGRAKPPEPAARTLRGPGLPCPRPRRSSDASGAGAPRTDRGKGEETGRRARDQIRPSRSTPRGGVAEGRGRGAAPGRRGARAREARAPGWLGPLPRLQAPGRALPRPALWSAPGAPETREDNNSHSPPNTTQGQLAQGGAIEEGLGRAGPPLPRPAPRARASGPPARCPSTRALAPRRRPRPCARAGRFGAAGSPEPGPRAPVEVRPVARVTQVRTGRRAPRPVRPPRPTDEGDCVGREPPGNGGARPPQRTRGRHPSIGPGRGPPGPVPQGRVRGFVPGRARSGEGASGVRRAARPPRLKLTDPSPAAPGSKVADKSPVR